MSGAGPRRGWGSDPCPAPLDNRPRPRLVSTRPHPPPSVSEEHGASPLPRLPLEHRPRTQSRVLQRTVVPTDSQVRPPIRKPPPSPSASVCLTHSLPLQPPPGVWPFPPGPAVLLTSFAAGAGPPPQAAVQELVCPRRAGPCHQPGSGFMQEHLGRRGQERFQPGPRSLPTPHIHPQCKPEPHGHSPSAWQAGNSVPDASDHSGPSGSHGARGQRPGTHCPGPVRPGRVPAASAAATGWCAPQGAGHTRAAA